jgi:DNA-binding GntR family transcriptional regulator
MKQHTIHVTPASRTLLVDQVTVAIRSAIVDGTIAPGMRLVEGDLAESLRVSRGPVREALRRLEQEGLVRIVPAGGTFVATLTEQDIRDIYGVRAALEGYAARQVGSRVAPLQSALEEMEAAFESRDMSGLIEADVRFHRTLVGLPGNGRLFGAWCALEAQMRLVLSVTRDRAYRDPQRLAERHRELLDAITSADADLAERRVREHIEGRIDDRLAYWRELTGRRDARE